jgi:hypothetical protein
MHWRVVFHFVLAALATWRISFFLAREAGPWNVLTRLRQAAGDGVVGQLLRCVKCVSLWMALPLAWFVGGTWTELAVVWLALSGVASLIDEATRPPFEWQETGNDVLRPDGD